MIRQHQFSKVELVSVTDPAESQFELDRMTSVAESVLKKRGETDKTTDKKWSKNDPNFS